MVLQEEKAMGTPTIVFEDGKDGEVKASISFDPPVDVEQDIATPAQRTMMWKWQRLLELEEEEE